MEADSHPQTHTRNLRPSFKKAEFLPKHVEGDDSPEDGYHPVTHRMLICAATEEDLTKIHSHRPKDLPLSTPQSPRFELGRQGARFEVFHFLASLAMRSWRRHGPAVTSNMLEERPLEGSKYTALVL